MQHKHNAFVHDNASCPCVFRAKSGHPGMKCTQQKATGRARWVIHWHTHAKYRLWHSFLCRSTVGVLGCEEDELRDAAVDTPCRDACGLCIGPNKSVYLLKQKKSGQKQKHEDLPVMHAHGPHQHRRSGFFQVSGSTSNTPSTCTGRRVIRKTRMRSHESELNIFF